MESPLDRLKRLVLSWDFWELDAEIAQKGNGLYDDLQPLPNSFKDVQDYKDYMEPLVLEECTSLLLRGAVEGDITVHRAVATSVIQKGAFTSVRLTLESAEVAGELHGTDVILLSKLDPFNEEDPTQDKDRQTIQAMAMVDGRIGEASLDVLCYLDGSAPLRNKNGPARVKAVKTALAVKKSGWHVMKLGSLSTIIREWIALQSVDRLLFKDALLSAKPAVSQKAALQVPQGMMEAMEKTYNDSQLTAVTAGLSGDPVVLIQGPPGTGKTKTILGLLGIVLYAAPEGSSGLVIHEDVALAPLTPTKRTQLWHAASPWACGVPNPRALVKPWEVGNLDDAFGLLDLPEVRHMGHEKGPRAHVLVCAPSNSALDEIVMRILQNGLMDRDGKTSVPSIVRVGLNIHHSVAKVSLENLMQQKLETKMESRGLQHVSHSEKDRARLEVLEETHIVCATLSFSGSALFGRMQHKFDVVVIDESAQAVEPATLIPLVTGCKQVFLVGDPEQLPATVLSQKALDNGYDVSLFKRLQTGGFPVQRLDTQYRMHPDISRFPCTEFYHGQLKDAAGMEKATTRPWSKHKCFGPLAFYDVPGKEEAPEKGASKQNSIEAEVVVLLLGYLLSRFPQLKEQQNIGIISPYKAQVKLLQENIKGLGKSAVDVASIDGFQGREKDIIIFSTVRSKVGKSIGFVADERRINVGLTRARTSLIIVGNAKALKGDKHWGSLVRHCLLTNCLWCPTKPLAPYIEKAVTGAIQPLKPPPEVEQWQPEAEPGAYSDNEGYSDTEHMPEGQHPGVGDAAKQAARYAAPAVKAEEASSKPSRKRGRQPQ